MILPCIKISYTYFFFLCQEYVQLKDSLNKKDADNKEKGHVPQEMLEERSGRASVLAEVHPLPPAADNF